MQWDFGRGQKIQQVKIVEFDASGVRTGVEEVEKIEKPDGEWRKQLTAEQYQIGRAHV